MANSFGVCVLKFEKCDVGHLQKWLLKRYNNVILNYFIKIFLLWKGEMMIDTVEWKSNLWPDRMNKDLENISFQQDDAKSHIAGDKVVLLWQKFIERMISRTPMSIGHYFFGVMW